MHGLSYGPALTRNTKERASVCQSDQVGLRPPRVTSHTILTRTIFSSMSFIPNCRAGFISSLNLLAERTPAPFYQSFLRQYYPRKLLSPLKSGMGRGLRPPRSVASVERTPAARPLLSIGRASGSTSGSALELVYAGGGGRPKLLSPCHVTLGLTISSLIYREQTGPVPLFASLNRLSSPLSYRPAGL